MNRRLFIHTILLAATFVVTSVITCNAKNADAFFILLVACYGAAIAATGRTRCIRRNHRDSARQHPASGIASDPSLDFTPAFGERWRIRPNHWMPHIREILISGSPSSPMIERDKVIAIVGKGLEGDRYFAGTGTFSPHPQRPDFELTLIESENVEAFARESGIPFTAAHARRNLVTEGIDLNALAGREFRIGSTRIRGIRLCEPCNHLAKTTWPETLKGLVHKGGLRAQIVEGGTIQVGDALVVV